MSEAIAQKLEEACALIERGWCQGANAESDNGLKVQYDSPLACRFCASGAIQRVAPGSFVTMREILNRVTGARLMVEWNDAPERTQAEVIQAFKKAAELARGLK